VRQKREAVARAFAAPGPITGTGTAISERLDMQLVTRAARGLAVIGGLALAGCGSGEKQAADAPAAAPA
jgi:hypothetical protein